MKVACQNMEGKGEGKGVKFFKNHSHLRLVSFLFLIGLFRLSALSWLETCLWTSDSVTDFSNFKFLTEKVDWIPYAAITRCTVICR